VKNWFGAIFGAALVACFWCGGNASAQTQQATFAGVAYSGDAASIPQRFAYSERYSQSLKVGGDSLYKRTLGAIERSPGKAISIVTEPIDDLKGRDQALVVSLVLNSETVSVEDFGTTRKLLVLIRGQALFFDFKSMAVVRSYPLSFAFVDNFSQPPTQAAIEERVRLVYEGAQGKPGIIERFANSLANATVPTQTSRYLQVSSVRLPADMVESLPAFLRQSPNVYETWAADIVAEAFSTRIGVPIVPYSKGYAVGNVMSMKILDGTVFNLALPKPDYEISVEFKGFKKLKYSQNAAGASFIYGSYADIRIQEPLSGTTYLATSLKNGEVKIVPASQTFVDDFPAYYDSLNAMFVKLSEAVAVGKGNSWTKSAASAADFEAQLVKTKDLMNLCK
jgi:hypothetical protein